MTNHEDQLRVAFETHENQGPDPAAVYARVQELARGYRWRRRGAQAAGGAVLSAGLIAGVINLPAILPGSAQGNAAVAIGAPAAASPSPTRTPSDAELQKDWTAFFDAGYGYDDAVQLAQLWNLNTSDIGSVKAEAGRRLLAGETLPIQPGPETTAGPGTDNSSKEDSEVAAFFAAGYTYDDAVVLAGIWKTADPYRAKIEGGTRLLAGQTLPIRP